MFHGHSYDWPNQGITGAQMDPKEKNGWQTMAITFAAIVLSYVVLSIVNYFVVAWVLQAIL